MKKKEGTSTWKIEKPMRVLSLSTLYIIIIQPFVLYTKSFEISARQTNQSIDTKKKPIIIHRVLPAGHDYLITPRNTMKTFLRILRIETTNRPRSMAKAFCVPSHIGYAPIKHVGETIFSIENIAKQRRDVPRPPSHFIIIINPI